MIAADSIQGGLLLSGHNQRIRTLHSEVEQVVFDELFVRHFPKRQAECYTFRNQAATTLEAVEPFPNPATKLTTVSGRFSLLCSSAHGHSISTCQPPGTSRGSERVGTV